MPKRLRPVARKGPQKPAAPAERPHTPPLPDNPYRRFFTQNRSFEELAKARKLR